MVVLENPPLDSSMLKKTAVDLKAKNRNREKDAGVLLKLNYSILNTLALNVIQVFDRNFFNLAKVSTVPCMYAATLSLTRLDSLGI